MEGIIPKWENKATARALSKRDIQNMPDGESNNQKDTHWAWEKKEDSSDITTEIKKNQSKIKIAINEVRKRLDAGWKKHRNEFVT